MKKNFFFLNSSNNTFIWQKNLCIRVISLYQTFFIGSSNSAQIDNVCQFDKTTNTWCRKVTGEDTQQRLKKKHEVFFFSFNFFFFKKFKFVGKGYKIKKVKTKKSFQLFFGYSHKIFLISGGSQLRKLTKYKLFLITNSKKKLNKITLIVNNIRKLNIFTKRGLRAIKQRIHKRPGKKSTY